MTKIFLVSFCSVDDIIFLKEKYKNKDILVGVDQGTKMLIDNGLTPDYIVGDFDSFLVGSNLAEKSKIIRLPKEKSESDLECALKLFLNFSSDKNKPIQCSIIIINNMLGRLDHILTSLHLLEQGANICIWSAMQQIYFVSSKFEAELSLGTTLSLVPVTAKVKVCTSGLKYHLDNEYLYRKKTRGLSNISVSRLIKISVKNGCLFVIINSKKGI